MSGRTPDHVDAHVGRKIAARRAELGQSQATLAEGVGVSFQQVQKYEHGGNRVSASALVKIATAQGLPVASYFEGLGIPATVIAVPAHVAQTKAWMQTPDAWQIARHAATMNPECLLALRRVAVSLSNIDKA